MRINNENLLLINGVAQPADMSVDITFAPVWLGHICNYSMQFVFTGSPNGTFKLQISDDQGRNTAALAADQSSGVTNWTDVTGSAQPISAAGNHAYQVENAGYAWVRAVYTASSGSGTVTSARCNVKGV